MGQGQNLPSGKTGPATSSQPAVPSASNDNTLAEIRDTVVGLQSALLRIQELLAPSSPAAAASVSQAAAAHTHTCCDVTTLEVTMTSTTVIMATAAAGTGLPSPESGPPTLASAAAAPLSQAGAPDLFKMMDANGDGDIGFRELQEFAVAQLVSGQSTAEELKILFEKLDASAQVNEQTGSPAPSEPAPGDTGAEATLFASIDADKDGALSVGEMQDYVTQTISQVRTELDQLAELFETTAAT
jgi:Ca2+-binding EF-hand superfamily protein